MNKNCIIFGNEEKDLDKGKNSIKVKYIYPIRELEICLDNSFTNSLGLYFKKNNHIIECESNEERKEIKNKLEKKRNEFRKWEQDNIIKFFSDEENKYKNLEDNLLNISSNKDNNKENNKDNNKNEENERIELFAWQ